MCVSGFNGVGSLTISWMSGGHADWSLTQRCNVHASGNVFTQSTLTRCWLLNVMHPHNIHRNLFGWTWQVRPGLSGSQCEKSQILSQGGAVISWHECSIVLPACPGIVFDQVESSGLFLSTEVFTQRQCDVWASHVSTAPPDVGELRRWSRPIGATVASISVVSTPMCGGLVSTRLLCSAPHYVGNVSQGVTKGGSWRQTLGSSIPYWCDSMFVSLLIE